MMKRVVIDVVSDVVCPWCYVGKHRLEAALALRPDVETEIHWRPYFLDPRVPREGMARVDYLSRKFGSDERIRPAHERLSRLGREEGIEFHFERITWQPNTLDAHRLIGWAEEAGRAGAIVEKILSLFFTEGADLSKRETLLLAAQAGGLDLESVRRDLAGERDVAAVEKAATSAAERGISGVPFFIFNNRFAVAGAQPPDMLAEAMDKTLAEAA
jgi:predicted DsbA family dithiol-disulfide isomerase